jgi:hypothetical protein
LSVALSQVGLFDDDILAGEVMGDPQMAHGGIGQLLDVGFVGALAGLAFVDADVDQLGIEAEQACAFIIPALI